MNGARHARAGLRSAFRISRVRFPYCPFRTCTASAQDVDSVWKKYRAWRTVLKYVHCLTRAVCVQKFMYSREQEAAMRRAAGQNATNGFIGTFNGLQFLMPWVRARVWEIFGYGLERQPPVERKPRTWTPPTEAGYKGGSISGDIDAEAATTAESTTPNAVHDSGGAAPVDCARAHVLTPEEKEVIQSHRAVEESRKVPEEEGSEFNTDSTSNGSRTV